MEANAGKYIKNHLHLKRFPRISLHFKLVPVQFEYGLWLSLLRMYNEQNPREKLHEAIRKHKAR